MRVFVRAAFLAAAFAAGSSLAMGGPATGSPPLVIHIKDFAYAPSPLTIHVGDSVTFVNDDDEAHTVTARDKSFDSLGLDAKGSWKHAFTKPGTYAYFCALHPYMKATIVVLPAEKAS